MHRFVLRTIFAVTVLTVALAAAGSAPAAPPGGTFAVTPLVSDVPGEAAVTDGNLVNAWGLARSATSPWWVSDNGAMKATVYDSAGGIFPIVVTVDGAPTGVVFAGIDDNFPVATKTSATLAPARFIFAGEDGMIRAWRGGETALVTASGGTDATGTTSVMARTASCFSRGGWISSHGAGSACQAPALRQNADRDPRVAAQGEDSLGGARGGPTRLRYTESHNRLRARL